MKVLSLIKRNCKLFFKDKGMFFTSLITPVILLVLYATFLANVFRESFVSNLNGAIEVPDKLVNATVGGELVSSLLAVSCITVAFCSNMLMVQDKVSGAFKDLTMAPVKRSTLAVSYYVATFISTFIVNFVAMALSLTYLAVNGWYLSAADVFLMLLDVVILVMFGTALSSIINLFLSSQGQISAVGTIVSAGYGFVCGAYMPISSFSKGLQYVISCLPGTYGTSLIRNHALAGVFREMSDTGFPETVIESIKDSIDCNIYFFANKVSVSGMYIVMLATVFLLLGVYVLLSVLLSKRRG